MSDIRVIRTLMAGVATALVVGATPSQAAQAAAQPPPARKPAAAAPKVGSARVAVKDSDGTSLSGVRLLLSGAGTGEFVTGGAGTTVVPNLKDGVYRLRCEHEGFITLEREFTMRGGGYTQVDVVLNAAPPPPPPPKPEPEPPPPAPVPGKSATLSIVDFLERNHIGREPLKESIVACNPLETVRLLQMREAVAQHNHDNADEIIYVVAGEGSVRMGDANTPVRPGSLVVVPTGTGHAFD